MNNKNKYTTHEIRFLKANFSDYGLKYCAEALNKSEGSIYGKIGQLRKLGFPLLRNRDLAPTKGVNRPCVLENIYSGRVIASDSIAGFCREAKLYGNSKYHINPILAGQRFSHKNWFLPEILSRKLELVDVYGNEYNLTIKELILKYKLSATYIKRLLQGKSVYGLHPKKNFEKLENKIIPVKNYNIKKYIFSKGKKQISGKTMEEVGDKIGRSIGSVYNVVHGFKESQDGYKFEGIVVEPKTWL